jgi:hypothetical protein
VSHSRKPLFTVPTPFPGVQQLTLFQDTWENHIVTGHVYMSGRETTVHAIASSPSVVLSGGNPNPGYVVYLNQSLTTLRGSPIAVIVDPHERVIVTAYPDRSLRIIESGRVLWRL